MAGERVERWEASSWACSTPLPARAGSDGMPVGVGIELWYCPVLESTTQLERNCEKRQHYFRRRTARARGRGAVRRSYSMPGYVDDFETHCCLFFSLSRCKT